LLGAFGTAIEEILGKSDDLVGVEFALVRWCVVLTALALSNLAR